LIQSAIRKVAARKSLTAREAEEAMGEIMGGAATPAQIAGLVMALKTKGETADEVSGFARSMRRHGIRLSAGSRTVADTCGTGGDGLNTLNISTGAALVVAGAGITVAKHGNRAMSSRCGSADVFAALGVNVEASPLIVKKCLDGVGIAFCFAQVFHPAMKYAGPSRRELGIQTVFNLLGPLTNPAGAQVQLIGVPRADLLELEACALARLGTRRSLLVHGADGMDEMTTTAPIRAILVAGHAVKRRFVIDARSLGFRRARISDLKGGSPADNALVLLAALKGRRGPYRDAILLNAGAVVWLAGKAGSLKGGIATAESALDSGAALEKLNRLRDSSRAEDTK
jgi:anthranilate phosphoribosyltransferase